MGRGGRMGGEGNLAKRGAWLFFAACLVVAIWGEAFTNPSQVLPTMARKSAQLERTVHEWVGKVGLTEDGSQPSLTVPKPAPKKASPAPK